MQCPGGLSLSLSACFSKVCCLCVLSRAIMQVWTQPLFSFVEERIFLKFPDALWMQKDLARCTPTSHAPPLASAPV